MEVGNRHNLDFGRLQLDIEHFLVYVLIQSPRFIYVIFQGIKITLINSNPPKLFTSISNSALGLFERCDSFLKKGATSEGTKLVPSFR